MKQVTISIDPTLLIGAPLLVLIIPLKWTLAFLLAAWIHEAAHLLFVLIGKEQIFEIRLGLSGAVIHASVSDPRWALISILMGPASSCFLFLFHDTFPELAYLGFFQGIVNMIPIFPLDGGRMLQIILNTICPKHTDHILIYTRNIILSLLSILFIYTFLIQNPPLSGCILLILFSLIRKTPCKENIIKVQ